MSEPPTKDPESHEDVVALLGRSSRGHVRALRKQGDQVGLAELRPLEAGKPLASGEVISLKKREGSPVLWDVDVLWSGAEAQSAHKGPVRVTSAAYRTGWDAIFRETDEGELN